MTKESKVCVLSGFLLISLMLSACSKPAVSSSDTEAAEKIQMPSSVADESALLPPELSVVKPVTQTAAPLHSSGTTNSNELLLADFNSGDKPNNLNGDFGVWNKDPDDRSQGCSMSFEEDDALGVFQGQSLRLDYDVESENPAYNGFWMKLNGLDVSAYNTVSLYIRGEGLKNFTKRIKFEIKDSANHLAPYIVSGITEKWQKIEIPFERFRKIQDWSAMGEFVVVFDDMNSDPQQGTILIDQIAFKKK